MPDERNLQKRVEHLEAQVEELERRLSRRQEAPQSQPLEERPEKRDLFERVAAVLIPEGGEDADLLLSSEDWLNKLGVGLLLFGVAFLFRYSIEAGWLTPAVRVLFGTLLGGSLAGLGMRLHKRRERLGQMLMGGSSATFYTTIFAAYQLYGLLAYPSAFGGMIAVTALTFFLAVREDDGVLAVVGVIGGLGTPFVLYTDAGTLAGLVGYTCLVLAGACAVYFYRGWQALLYTAVLGGWLTFGFALANLPGRTGVQTSSDRWAVQLGVLFGWLVFWVVPVLRELLRRWHPDSWQKPAGHRGGTASSLVGAFLFRPPAHTLAFSSPLVALVFSRNIWLIDDALWAGVALVGSLLYGLAYLGLHRSRLETLAQAHGLVAAVLLAYGLSELFGGDTLLLALAAEAAALHYLADRLKDRALRLTGHLFFGLVAALFALRVVLEQSALPLLDAEVLTEGVTLLLAGGASMGPLSSESKRVYRLAVHVLFLGWLWHVLSALPNGPAYVTVSWGLYAVVLLVLGVRQQRAGIRDTALGTIFLVVGKLFLVDLSELEAIWRVLLFMGLGSTFLTLSYYLPRLLQVGPEVEKG